MEFCGPEGDNLGIAHLLGAPKVMIRMIAIGDNLVWLWLGSADVRCHQSPVLNISSSVLSLPSQTVSSSNLYLNSQSRSLFEQSTVPIPSA